MKREEFEAQQQAIPDDKLVEMAQNALSKLCETGGRSLTMTVPPRVDDTDMIISELIRRFKDKQPLPPAKGAEAQRCPVCNGNGLVANGFYNQTSGYWSTSSISPETCRTCNGTGVILPSYLHAQQIADKMVSERLREELIKYDKYIGSRGWIDNYEDWAAITSVDEYLKSREK